MKPKIANRTDPPPDIDLSNATVELPADNRAQPETESPLVTSLRQQIERLKAANARLIDPLGENFQILKNCAADSGIPRQTLGRWARDGLVKHYYDKHGALWICVNDAIRQRFALASAP